MILRHSTLQYFTSLHAVHNFNLTSSTAALPQQAQHNIASAALSSSTALILSISMISFLGTFTRSKINYRNSKLVPPGGFGGVLGLSPALVLSTFLLSHHGIVLSNLVIPRYLERLPTNVTYRTQKNNSNHGVAVISFFSWKMQSTQNNWRKKVQGSSDSRWNHSNSR